MSAGDESGFDGPRTATGRELELDDDDDAVVLGRLPWTHAGQLSFSSIHCHCCEFRMNGLTARGGDGSIAGVGSGSGPGSSS